MQKAKNCSNHHTSNGQPSSLKARALFEREFEQARKLVNFPLQPILLKNPKFLSAIASLERLALDERLQTIAPEVMRDPKILACLDDLRRINEFYEITLEVNHVTKQLRRSNPAVEDAHLARDATTAKLESKTARITTDSHIAFVGSGPFPSTAIALVQEYGCRVTCIDCNIEAVVISDQLLSRMQNLNIDVFYSFGEEVNYKQYSHVLIAALIHNRTAIFQRIRKSLPSGRKVICRHGRDLQQLIYQGFDGRNFEGFRIEQYMRDPKNTFTSVILTKI